MSFAGLNFQRGAAASDRAMTQGPILEVLTRLETGINALQLGMLALEQGQSTLDQRITGLETGLSTLQQGQSTLEQRMIGLEQGQISLRNDFFSELGKTRADVMQRMDRLQNRLDLLDDHLNQGLGNSDRVERKSDGVVEQNRIMAEQLSNLHKIIRRLEGRINDLENRIDDTP